MTNAVKPSFWSMINRYLWRVEIFPAAMFQKYDGGMDVVRAFGVVAKYFGRPAANDS